MKILANDGILCENEQIRDIYPFSRFKFCLLFIEFPFQLQLFSFVSVFFLCLSLDYDFNGGV